MYDSNHIQNVAAVIVATVYAMAGISLLLYTNSVKKRLDQLEQEEKLRRQAKHQDYSHGNESTHKSDPMTPLLGVVYPKDK